MSRRRIKKRGTRQERQAAREKKEGYAREIMGRYVQRCALADRRLARARMKDPLGLHQDFKKGDR